MEIEDRQKPSQQAESQQAQSQQAQYHRTPPETARSYQAWQYPSSPPSAGTPGRASGWGWQPTDSAVPAWQPADPTAPHVATVAGRPRRPGRVARWITAGVAGLALVAGAGVAGGAAVHALDGRGIPTTSTSALATKATTGVVSAADIVATVQPSVVTIAARSQGGTSEGSGVIVRSDGMIVTNNHVVSGASGTITVTFRDGTNGTATVVASDPTNDLALLQVADAKGLTAISFGDGSSVAVGDDVIAIGNPLGLGISASEGIVSALSRPVNISTDQSQGVRGGANSSVSYSAIQTDAAVNEGNSGGALVNTSGQLIGITSAIATSGTSTGNLGVAFAIPSNQVHTFVNKALS